MIQATKTKPAAPEALILDIATRHFFMWPITYGAKPACPNLPSKFFASNASAA